MRRSTKIKIFVAVVVVCVIIALGLGLGLGLKKTKSSSSSSTQQAPQPPHGSLSEAKFRLQNVNINLEKLQLEIADKTNRLNAGPYTGDLSQPELVKNYWNAFYNQTITGITKAFRDIDDIFIFIGNYDDPPLQQFSFNKRTFSTSLKPSFYRTLEEHNLIANQTVTQETMTQYYLDLNNLFTQLSSFLEILKNFTNTIRSSLQ
jgi:hypothetical protein